MSPALTRGMSSGAFTRRNLFSATMSTRQMRQVAFSVFLKRRAAPVRRSRKTAPQLSLDSRLPGETVQVELGQELAHRLGATANLSTARLFTCKASTAEVLVTPLSPWGSTRTCQTLLRKWSFHSVTGATILMGNRPTASELMTTAGRIFRISAPTLGDLVDLRDQKSRRTCHPNFERAGIRRIEGSEYGQLVVDNGRFQTVRLHCSPLAVALSHACGPSAWPAQCPRNKQNNSYDRLGPHQHKRLTLPAQRVKCIQQRPAGRYVFRVVHATPHYWPASIRAVSPLRSGFSLNR